MPICTKCKLPKEWEDMSRDISRRGGFSSWCKNCRAGTAKAWKSQNTGRIKKKHTRDYLSSRNYMLKLRYGISLDQYEEIRESQNYLCGICTKDSREMTYHMHVDHNHETGKVRGLLCAPCNVFLGVIKDCPEKLERAKNWLHKEREDAKTTH